MMKLTLRRDDDKHGRRERGYSGPLTDFREKSNFRPTVKLDYVDDDGRPLAPKEAFRYLSHKFHGTGPGKNKQEKRIKKAVQEGVSASDTPFYSIGKEMKLSINNFMNYLLQNIQIFVLKQSNLKAKMIFKKEII